MKINWRSVIYLAVACAVVGFLIGMVIPPPLSFLLSMLAGMAMGWKWPWPIYAPKD